MEILKEMLLTCENLNELPSQAEIIKSIKSHFDIDNDTAELRDILNNMKDSWKGIYTLKDGINIELTRKFNLRWHCHSYHTHEPNEGYFDALYKVDDNLYVCSICLNLLERKSWLTDLYNIPSHKIELFPKKWDDFMVRRYLDAHYSLKSKFIGRDFRNVLSLPSKVKNEIKKTDRYKKIFEIYVDYIHRKEPTRKISKPILGFIGIKSIQCYIENKEPDLNDFHKRFSKTVTKSKKRSKRY